MVLPLTNTSLFQCSLTHLSFLMYRYITFYKRILISDENPDKPNGINPPIISAENNLFLLPSSGARPQIYRLGESGDNICVFVFLLLNYETYEHSFRLLITMGIGLNR